MKRCHMLFAVGLVLAVAIVGAISCSKKGGGGDADDGNSPYMILDLHVAAVTDSTVKLIWTATGDDGDVGKATTYDIRHHSCWITAANWDSATQVTGEPTPSTAGQLDSMVIHNLKKDSTYYFSVQAYDEAGNKSGLSNGVFANIVTDFAVAIPDAALEARIRNGVGKPQGVLMKSDLMRLIALDANNANIANLTGLEYCGNMLAIYGAMNSISDLTPIAHLTKLMDVQFFMNNISDISPLTNLVNMQRLVLRNNPVTDITGVSGLTNLRSLDLTNANVANLAPLAANQEFATGDTAWVGGCPLSQESIDTHIPVIRARGAAVIY
jgi:hypothetical protein